MTRQAIKAQRAVVKLRGGGDKVQMLTERRKPIYTRSSSRVERKVKSIQIIKHIEAGT